MGDVGVGRGGGGGVKYLEFEFEASVAAVEGLVGVGSVCGRRFGGFAHCGVGHRRWRQRRRKIVEVWEYCFELNA